MGPGKWCSPGKNLRILRITPTGRQAGPLCPPLVGKFMPGTMPRTVCSRRTSADSNGIVAEIATTKATAPAQILQPNLQMALDPHILDSIEAYPMKIAGGHAAKRVEWLVDGRLARTPWENEDHFMWPLTCGSHLAQDRIWPGQGENPLETVEVRFEVKLREDFLKYFSRQGTRHETRE